MSQGDVEDLPSGVNAAGLRDELSKHGKVKCPFDTCQQVFNSLFGLKYHIHRTNHDDTGGKFKCDRCGLSFQLRTGLQQHTVAGHSGSDESSPTLSPRLKDRDDFHFSTLPSKPLQKSLEKNSNHVSPDCSKNPVREYVLPSCVEIENERTSSKTVNNKDIAISLSGSPALNVKRKRGRPLRTVCTPSSQKKNIGHDNSIIENKSKLIEQRALESNNSESKDQTAALESGNVEKNLLRSSALVVKRKHGKPREMGRTSSLEQQKSGHDNSMVENESRLNEEKVPELKRGDSQNQTTVASENANSGQTPLRTSTRKRIQRTIFDSPVEKKTKEKRKKRRTGSEDQTPGKRKGSNLSARKKGRPRKSDVENVMEDDGKNDYDDEVKSDFDCNMPVRKQMKSRKATQNKTDKSPNSINDNDNEVGNIVCDNDADNDDDDDDNSYESDDGNDADSPSKGTKSTKRHKRNAITVKKATPRTRKKKTGTEEKSEFACDLCGREYHSLQGLSYHNKVGCDSPKQKPLNPEKAKLKKMLASGQRLKCPRQGCCATFASVLGYNLHINNCGTKMEERQTFTCETCSKVYFSMPGLQYHIKSVHLQPVKVESDHSDGANEGEQDEELQDGQRKRRRAASRAIKRFHKMATDSEAKKGMQGLLDQLIVNVKEGEVSKEQKEKWAKVLENDSAVQCPNKGCPETFASLSDLTTHVSTCVKRSGSYKCLACNKVCLTYVGARKHVSDLHTGHKGDENSGSTDEDFEACSSEESEEDDDDDVEIEEIEESDGNIEDQDTLTEEIVIWDKKRKRYRKPRKAKKSKKLLEELPLGKTRQDFGPIGVPDTDGYLTTETWRKEVYKHKELFPKLKPSVKYWSRVEASEVHKYLPSSSESPCFQIRRKGSTFTSTDDIRLPLFESTSKDDSCIHGDVTFNVGGPVWAMNWCPVPDSQTCEEQFLAIGTHSSLDEVHNIHKCFSGPGLVQLWNTGSLDKCSASSGIKPTLCLGIAHDHGAVWDISWCPSGTWETIGQNSPGVGGVDRFPRLGLMALACSDGYVRIFSIPWPKTLLSAPHTDLSVSTPGHSHVMVQAKPHFVLAPCAIGVEYDGQCGQAWCAKWFPGSLHEKIATGFSDGSVAIWNLLTESLLLKEPISGTPEAFSLAPFLHIKANCSVIKDVTWSPFDPHMLITGSHDRHYKVWNLNSPVLPLCSLKRGIPHEIHWPVVFDSFFSCEEDTFQTSTIPAAVRYLAFFVNEKSRSSETSALIVHNSTVWSLSVSDWADVLVSSDAAGEVVGMVLSESKKRRALRKFGIYRAFLENFNDDPSMKQAEENETEVKADEEPDERDRSQPNLTKQPPSTGDPSVTNEKEKLSPDSVEEVFQQCRLVFHDVNALEFDRKISDKDPDFRRLRSPSTMQSANYEELHPEAIHKVRFNPNKQSFTWLASGGAAGLGRLHLVKQVER